MHRLKKYFEYLVKKIFKFALALQVTSVQLPVHMRYHRPAPPPPSPPFGKPEQPPTATVRMINQ